MDIEEIKILKAIDKYGSINAAAENLFVAKSAISNAIKQSELEFGFKLLDRSGYRVKLSPKARMYLEKASRVIKLYDELDGFRKQLSEDIELSIRISSTTLYELSCFIDLIKATNKSFSNTTVYLQREILSGEAMLLNEEVDLAITETATDKTNLEYRKISKVEMPLLIYSNHEFLKLPKSKQNQEELNKYPQIVVKSTQSNSPNQGGIYKDAIHWQVTDDTTKLELIRKGLGWGRLPMHLVEKDIERGRLKPLCHIEKTLVLDLYLARRKNYSYGKVADFIWQSFASS